VLNLTEEIRLPYRVDQAGPVLRADHG
jgi:hypothetical protein